MTDLFERAKALQTEAYDVLARLNLEAAFPSFGPPVVIGSAVSGLMVWRDLDVMFTAPAATPADVFQGLARLSKRPGLLAADFRDERADRRPTPAQTDERFYVVLEYLDWKIDLTIWLHAVPRPHVAEAHALAALPLDQRRAILELKTLWSTSPHYPYTVGSTDIYEAVTTHAIRTPEALATHLATRHLPTTPH